jgi:hypothetical protein
LSLGFNQNSPNECYFGLNDVSGAAVNPHTINCRNSSLDLGAYDFELFFESHIFSMSLPTQNPTSP